MHSKVNQDLIEKIRKTIINTLEDQSFDYIGINDPLIQSGLICSLNIIQVTLALEGKFNISIPDSEITVSNYYSFQTLANKIAEIKYGSRQQYQTEFIDSKFFNSFSSSLKKPISIIFLLIIFLAGIDFTVFGLIKGPMQKKYCEFYENGNRLYPSAGTYSQRDYSFAVSQHKIIGNIDTESPRIGIFCDSGTIGSFVPFNESLSYFAEKEIQKYIPNTSVFDLSFWGTVLIKDLMILEAVIEQMDGEIPFNIVVFTISDNYFNRPFQRSQFDYYLHLPHNRKLFASFTKRFAGNDLLPYKSISSDLLNAYKDQLIRPKHQKHSRNIIRHLFGFTSLCRYGPFIREQAYKSLSKIFNRKFGSNTLEESYEIGKQELYPFILDSIPKNFKMHDKGIDKKNLDVRVITILEDVIDKLKKQNIQVILYLKPIAPAEWENLISGFKDITAYDIAYELSDKHGFKIADFRWALNGNQFSDDVSHYNRSGNQVLGEELANVIRKVWLNDN